MYCPKGKSVPKGNEKSASNENARVSKSTKNRKEKQKSAGPVKLNVKEALAKESSVPVSDCMNSVLMGLKKSNEVIALVDKDVASSSTNSIKYPGVSEVLIVSAKNIVVDQAIILPEAQALVVSHISKDQVKDVLSASVYHVGEAPFVPAVNTVPSKPLNDNHCPSITSNNQFAALKQEEIPVVGSNATKNFAMVISTPASKTSSTSPQHLSKSQKNKKRKLAKRSPNSGGSPPLSLGDCKPF